MPLADPPSAATLRRLPSERLARRVLHRIYRADRRSPWWFASQPDDPANGGRFDLAAPHGSCYLATTVEAATVEALQGALGRGLISRAVLERLALAKINPSSDAPRAARLTAASASAVGITAALWANPERTLTQRWAAALHRVWDAIYTGVQHDPTGRSRAVTLFDDAGEHPPYGDERWTWNVRSVADDERVCASLARHGLSVIGPGDLTVVPLDAPL